MGAGPYYQLRRDECPRMHFAGGARTDASASSASGALGMFQPDRQRNQRGGCSSVMAIVGAVVRFWALEDGWAILFPGRSRPCVRSFQRTVCVRSLKCRGGAYLEGHKTVKKAAEKLGVSTTAIYNLIRRGSLASRRIGNLHLIKDAELDKLQQNPEYQRKSRAARPSLEETPGDLGGDHGAA